MADSSNLGATLLAILAMRDRLPVQRLHVQISVHSADAPPDAEWGGAEAAVGDVLDFAAKLGGGKLRTPGLHESIGVAWISGSITMPDESEVALTVFYPSPGAAGLSVPPPLGGFTSSQAAAAAETIMAAEPAEE